MTIRLPSVFRAALIVIAVAIFVGHATKAAAQGGKPTILKDSEFVLTDAQSAAGIDGRIKISLDVDEKGVVKDAEIVAGPIYPCDKTPKAELEEFKRAALKNAKTFQFLPATKGLLPVKSKITLTVIVGNAFKATLEGRETNPLTLKKADYVDGDIINGKALSLPTPNWPAGGFGSGQVIVDVLIGKDGKMVSAGTISGPVVFHKYARIAACDAKFSQTLVSNRPVFVSGRIIYNFIDPR